jgi:glycosyltransferase involved in cell wall biosynthesis
MESLKVLYVSSGDLVGSRFNGFDWYEDLKKHNVFASYLVNWNHHSNSPNVENLSPFWNLPFLRKFRRLIFQSYLNEGIEFGEYPWSRGIFKSSKYKGADLVHLQIVHDGTLDLKSISRIMREKPTVWTWHDPWVLTGHCIYPMSCSRFKLGCGECPDLSRPFKIGKDLTKENRLEKQDLIAQSQIVHLSTKWFEKLVHESSNIQINTVVIPFALNKDFFVPTDKEASREKFGIPKENFVIGIRSVIEPQKNFKLFVEALRLISGNTNISIITLQESGQLDEFKNKFHILELPWTNDNSDLLSFYDALDVFIMPSLYETFGFMGLEAMAREVPVIGLANTALDEVCSIGDNGFLIANDPKDLSDKILFALSNPMEVANKSRLSREYAISKYSMDEFSKKLVEMYKKTVLEFDAK